MTFKEEIDDADKRYWKDAREERMMDILEACVNKIDELENDLENLSSIVKRLNHNIVEIADDGRTLDKRIESLQKQINKDPEL